MQRAKIDHDGIYWGPEEVEALSDGDIAAPDECIRPGAYRWDAAHGFWMPLEKKQVRKFPAAPSLEQAFAALVEDGKDSARVRAWLEAFHATVDGRRS